LLHSDCLLSQSPLSYFVEVVHHGPGLPITASLVRVTPQHAG
jgi:hypothetical protein